MTVDDPVTAGLPDAPVAFIGAPRHPILRQLYDYWLARRGARLMPAKADINPADIKPLLADVIIWNAVPPFLVRLVGDHIVASSGATIRACPRYKKCRRMRDACSLWCCRRSSSPAHRALHGQGVLEAGQILSRFRILLSAAVGRRQHGRHDPGRAEI
ncbi:MAG TPA: PAS domain-containing protein [Rhizomicrobium sp.]|nr:PAS domain-containing protein [Rhizomicrobium sp.]